MFVKEITVLHEYFSNLPRVTQLVRSKMAWPCSKSPTLKPCVVLPLKDLFLATLSK